MLTRTYRWLAKPKYLLFRVLIVVGPVLSCATLFLGGLNIIRNYSGQESAAFFSWMIGNTATRESLVTSQKEACPGAPFILPAEGYIGLLYGDPRGPYSSNSPHQGIDIFSPNRQDPGQMPVYAAYDGYITREEDWRSSLIQRIPYDPLQPGRQIWLYYTHMADRDGDDFISDILPPGTQEFFVEQGTLLGYTGNYNGNSPRNIWVHLHFSIVNDNGRGGYANELEFVNTIDPTPYLGVPVNFSCSGADVTCTLDINCD